MNHVLAVVVGGLGAYLVLRARHLQGRARASREWKVARGRFAKCKLREERSQTEYGPQSSWHIDVHYRFDVDGKQYSGRRRVWSEESFQSKLVAQLKHRALKRKAPKVLYNPEDPYENILYPGHAGSLRRTLWIGVALVVLAAVFELL